MKARVFGLLLAFLMLTAFLVARDLEAITWPADPVGLGDMPWSRVVTVTVPTTYGLNCAPDLARPLLEIDDLVFECMVKTAGDSSYYSAGVAAVVNYNRRGTGRVAPGDILAFRVSPPWAGAWWAWVRLQGSPCPSPPALVLFMSESEPVPDDPPADQYPAPVLAVDPVTHD